MPLAFNRHGVHYDSWWSATVPPTTVSLGAYSWVAGVFQFLVPGRIVGCRAYVIASAPFPRLAAFWEFSTAKYLGVTRMFPASPVAGKWVQAYFRPMIRIKTNTFYDIAIQLSGGFVRTTSGAAAQPTHTNIQFMESFQTTGISPIDASPTINNNANGVDVLFYPD